MKKREIVDKPTKEQIQGLRSYRRSSVLCLSFIILLSLWLKITFNTEWHFNDIIVDVISLFIIMFMGILANIKNDFPIFNNRSFIFTKDFLYSIVSFLSLLFFFIIYKNITEPDFISYLASLSFHDLTTILITLFPVFIFIIYLIYIGLKIIDKDKIKKKKELITYSEKIEKSLDSYKNTTINIIFIIMLLSIWIKVGFLITDVIPNIAMELSSIITIITMIVVGNIDNKLKPLYNKHIYLDKYFIYSLLLPYFLIILYAIFSKDFRILVGMAGFVQVTSLLVSMMPLFLVASLLFYFGLQSSSVRKKKEEKIVKSIVVNKVKTNTLIALTLTLIIISMLFYYSFSVIIKNYSLENILQVIILFIPLSVIIYLIIYSCIREINK